MVCVGVSSSTIEAYAQKYYVRAQQHVAEGNWTAAMQELKEAIKCAADKSEYHALLGVVYFNQKLAGMARVYIGQALKLNPHDPIALAYATKVGFLTQTKIATAPQQSNRWLGFPKFNLG